MPRHGELSAVEKCRSVFAHVGRPAAQVELMDDGEQQQLAAIYDECIAPGMLVKQRFDEFWSERVARLAESKATDETTDE